MTTDRKHEWNVGDRVEYMGFCYKITKIDGANASIALFRKTRNPRCRRKFATVPVADLTPYQGRVK